MIAAFARPGHRLAFVSPYPDVVCRTVALQDHTVALQEHSPPAPVKLRIGPCKHNYIYSLVTNGVYKCCRGSDNAVGTAQLWLLRIHDEWPVWIAFDGADDGDIPPVGRAIFCSSENILIAGYHQWRMEMRDGREGSFLTTLL